MDADGNVDSTSNASITFSIVSGPGKVVATHNGDVQNHEPNLGASHAAYHGMVRGVVRVTENSASPSWVRSRLLHIGAEAAAVRTKLQPDIIFLKTLPAVMKAARPCR